MEPKKILITGVSGQVGHAILPVLSDFEVIGLTRQQLDLTDLDAIKRVISKIKPDLIINPAAYTAVDKAESEPELAKLVNCTAPRIIAEEAAKAGAALIHFSTDYVYDGTKTTPYSETDTVNPTSSYGKSKLAGEKAIIEIGLPHLILRTSWIYGAYGHNFLKAILRIATEKEGLTVVSDQFGAPTSSRSIAHAMYYLVKQWDIKAEEQAGIYHVTNSGRTSWHGFAKEIINEYTILGKTPALKAKVNSVEAVTSSKYPTAATRPENSCLDNRKLERTFGVILPTWQHGLQEVMQHL